MSDSVIHKAIFSVLPGYIYTLNKNFMIINCNIQPETHENAYPNICVCVCVTVVENYTYNKFQLLMEFIFNIKDEVLLGFNIIDIRQIKGEDLGGIHSK